jgi:phosphomethylpyrimidine synthase
VTQLQLARQGHQTPEMEEVARREGLRVEQIQEGLARGVLVLPANALKKKIRPVGIGRGLTIKVNANIGTSSDHIDLDEELTKLQICVDAGADTVMDLSTGGDLADKCCQRRLDRILAESRSGDRRPARFGDSRG